ncbi:MAG: FHA domain-containing protein [Verrucomicrobiota bacterium]
MADTALTQYLQFQGQEAQTGCIVVHTPKDDGKIYLHHGNVVYAETRNGRGLFALYFILTWKDVTLEWHPDLFVSTIAFNEPVDTVLFQFAQLEDAGQTSEESLVLLFHGSEQPHNEIKLTELKHYVITFEILNAEFHGLKFNLHKDITLVGRAEDCDVILPDPTVTSHHCTIAQETNCIRISDLGSTNGTFINGKLISNAILQVGDDLFVGKVGMRMSMKMHRHLVLASDTALSTEEAARQTASNINVDEARQKVLAKGAREAITWKSLEGGAKIKSASSLLGRIFKKGS